MFSIASDQSAIESAIDAWRAGDIVFEELTGRFRLDDILQTLRKRVAETDQSTRELNHMLDQRTRQLDNPSAGCETKKLAVAEAQVRIAEAQVLRADAQVRIAESRVRLAEMDLYII